jgi:Fe-S cluster assembly scaffold protein SufB
MTDNKQMIDDLYSTTDTDSNILKDPEVAYLVVHHNQVLGAHLIPGLKVEVKELEDGIDADIRLQEGTIVRKPVHFCFGMFPETGVQRILLTVNIEKNSKISLLAHCTFPNAVDVKHIMNATINVGENAEYAYFERHIHGDKGGVKVYPNAVVELGKGSKFKTEFELLKGRVGEIYVDYSTTCQEYSVMEMTARINGTGDDIIHIKETGHLVGEGARGVLTSRIAVRENAKAEVYNDLTASAPYTRGHVDCKEIIQGNGVAKAVPIVQVGHPKAHVTHEAAIGSVDNKQLETLMARGLSEDDAVNLIIEGLLS